MHRKVAAALVAALALGIASCGGSESETTTLSRAELVRRVEVACRDSQRESRRQLRAAGDSPSQDAFIDAILTAQRSLTDELDGWDASGAARADFTAFKDGLQDRLELIERVASADRADRDRVMRSIQSGLEAAGRKTQEAARSLGIDACI